MKALPPLDPLVAKTGCEAKKVCLQLRQSWRNSSAALQLSCDDFQKRAKRREVKQFLRE